MKAKYSKAQFEGYTHRFVIQFEIGEPHFHTLQIYSDSESYQELEDFLNRKKTERVKSFKIVHRATKAQDEISEKFINEN